MVENVETEGCSGCGEPSLAVGILDRISGMVQGEHPVKEVRGVEAASA